MSKGYQKRLDSLSEIDDFLKTKSINVLQEFKNSPEKLKIIENIRKNAEKENGMSLSALANNFLERWNWYIHMMEEALFQYKKLKSIGIENAKQLKATIEDNGYTDMPALMAEVKYLQTLKNDWLSPHWDQFCIAAFTFRAQIASFLDRRFTFVFVLETEDGPQTYVFNDGETMKSNISVNFAGVGTGIRETEYQDAAAITKQNRSSMLENSISGRDRKGLEALQSTYKEIMDVRRIVYYGKRKKSGKAGNAFEIFWHPHNIKNKRGWFWSRMKISSGGNVKEAYASFVLEGTHLQQFIWKDMEEKIDIFLLGKGTTNLGVNKVTSLSGLLQGDFSINGTEYEIKGSGAGTMSIKEIIRYARYLAKTGNGNYYMEARALYALDRYLEEIANPTNRWSEDVQWSKVSSSLRSTLKAGGLVAPGGGPGTIITATATP